MGVEIGASGGQHAVSFHEKLYAAHADTPSAAREKECAVARLELVPTGEVGTQGGHRITTEGYDSFLTSFAEDAHLAELEVEHVDVDAAELRYAQAGAVERLEDGAVAQAGYRSRVGRLDDLGHGLGVEEHRHGTNELRHRQLARGIDAREPAFLEVAIERTHRGHLARDGGGLGAARSLSEETAKHEDVHVR